MKVKWETKSDRLPQIQAKVKAIDGTAVEVGALDGEHAWLAGIHEYGCNIPVTPKMRAYLHSQGLHLSPKTKEIHIPERSFLRSGYDDCKDTVIGKVATLLADVVNGTMSEEQLYETAGIMLSDKIRAYARNLSTPPNHPFTVDRKGSSNPLVDTGEMIGSITWRKA